MAGKGDIKAGRAYVELFVKNSALVKGLNQASKRLKSFGAGVAKFGGALAGMGASIVGPLMGAINHFASVGDALDKMSARTGISATALAEYGFAAEQSGASIGDIEKGVRRMQKTIGDAADGTATGVDALAKLGLTMEDVAGKTPEQQFDLMMSRLADIEDPTARAAAAMETFGKSGTALLPMLDSVEQLRKEARDLGIAPSPESTAAAAELTDAMNRVRRSVMGVVYEVGSQLAPVAIRAAKVVLSLIRPAIEWVKTNGNIIRTVAAVGVVLLGAGTAIVALGGGIAALGFVLGGLATALTTAGAILGTILSPIGLITVAIGAGIYIWAKYTDSGKRAVSSLKETFAEIGQTAKDTFGGIWDAIAGGDLALAGKIAFAGLKLAAATGLAALSDLVGGIFGEMLAGIGGQLLDGDVAGAWETIVLGMASIWDAFSEGVISTFTNAARAVVDAWQTAVSEIARMMLDITSSETTMGQTLRPFLGPLGRMGLDAVMGGDMGEIQRERDRLNSQLGLGPENVLDEAGQSIDINVSGTADAIRDQLQSLDETARARTDESSATLADRTRGADGRLSDVTESLADELAELRTQAAAAAAKAAAERNKPKPEPDDDPDGPPDIDAPDVGKLRSQMSVTFSAAAFASLGSGGGPQERTAKAVEQIVKISRDAIKKDEEQILAIKALGFDFG